MRPLFRTVFARMTLSKVSLEDQKNTGANLEVDVAYQVRVNGDVMLLTLLLSGCDFSATTTLSFRR